MKTLIFMIVSTLSASFHSQSIDCGDLLTLYASKPKELKFVECKKGEGQVVLEAKYKIAGNQSETVEKFLVNTYGMGALTFTCCGWEPKDGKSGQYTSDGLKANNPNYFMVIDMFGNGEKKNSDGNIYIEKDRNQIEYFEVSVKIVDI